MITYKTASKGISVKTDKIVTGKIVQVEGGWQYIPKAGKKYAGDVYPTLALCKCSTIWVHRMIRETR